MKTENETIKAKNDEFEAKEALAVKMEMVEKLLKESELPKEMITDYFKESLLKLEDEDQVKKSIEDRKKVTEASKGKVVNSGDEFTGDKEKNEKVTDADKKAVIEAVKSQ